MIMDTVELEKQLSQLFRACDLDGSGYIDKEELSTICQDLSGEDLTDVFQQLDQDGDNKISVEEFAKGYRKIAEARDSKKRELIRQRLKSDKSEDNGLCDEHPMEDLVGGLDDGLSALSW